MRRRIVWGAVAIAMVTLILAVAAVAVVQRRARDDATAELFRQAEATARLLTSELAGAEDASLGVRAAAALEAVRLVGGHDIVEAAVVRNGTTRFLSRNPVLLPRLPAELVDRTTFTLEVDGADVFTVVRLVGVRAADVRVAIVIGTGDPFPRQGALVGVVVWSLLVGVLLAAGLGAALAGSTRRRLDRLADAAGEIAAGNLAARAPADGNDEIAGLGAAFNAMAGQLEASRARERRFLQSVSHDLRTPLTTIRGYAEALAGGDVAGEDLGRVAGVLEAQTQRLSRLVEDVMLLARLEAREFTLRPEPVDLAAHLGGVVEALRPRADAGRVRLESRLEPVGTVPIDPDRVAQVAQNLIENALRYTPELGTVSIGLGRTDAAIELTVADTGPGIEPEDLPRVFERLYVSERYRPLRPEGSGLGLAIVAELTRAMGGTASVGSRPGAGTTVTVRWPVSPG